MTATGIPLAVPNIGARERELVLEAIDSGFVSSVGPFVTRFEEEFAARVGAKHAVACASGTAAIHVGLVVLGVTAGDLVAVSDFTFVGSANPVRYQAADVLLIDSETSTWNMCPDALADELERRSASGEPMPVAVEVVHVLGQPARLESIMEICAPYGLPILEDAAESLGAGWSGGANAGCHTGTVAAVGAFSFNGNKIATTGGGGMLVTNDTRLAARAKHLTTQAKVPGVGYLHDEVGYNYRLSNIGAALGIAQLERLGEFVDIKRRIAKDYDDAFTGLALERPPRIEGSDSTYWLYSVLVSSGDRDGLLGFLAGRQIDARPLWRPLHAQPPFAACQRAGGEVASDLFARGVSLPCSTSLSEADQRRVIEAVLEYMA